MDPTVAALIGWGLLLIMVVVIVVISANKNIRATIAGAMTPTGPTFTIDLTPQMKAAAVEQVKEAAIEKGRGGSTSEAEAAARDLKPVARIRPGTILWVDDEPETVANEVLSLGSLGLSILQAASTRTALKWLIRWHEETPGAKEFDLVITDLTRDGDRRAGLSLIDTIRERGWNVPVIVYTLDPGERAQEALNLGAEAVLTMPGPLLDAVVRHFRAE